MAAVLGMELLIEHYQHERNTEELPCQLDKPCAGGQPPPLSLSVGYTNVLHKAIFNGKCYIWCTLVYHKNTTWRLYCA